MCIFYGCKVTTIRALMQACIDKKVRNINRLFYFSSIYQDFRCSKYRKNINYQLNSGIYFHYIVFECLAISGTGFQAITIGVDCI